MAAINTCLTVPEAKQEDEVGANAKLRKYQEFWIPSFQLPTVMALQQQFKARPSDVLLVSMIKSGTTWLKALICATMIRDRYSPLAPNHPLLNMNPHDLVPTIEAAFDRGNEAQINALSDPRLLSTHIPCSLHPESVVASGCRMVYVCRDPKDTFVSSCHFWEALTGQKLEPLQFGKLFDECCEGFWPYGPIWDHHLVHWRESLRRPERVLFLQYEEMMEDTVGNVRRLAEFLGCPFSQEEERAGLVEEIATLCSFEKLRNLDVNKTGVHGSGEGFLMLNASFFRKGKIGDWENHLSPEMAQRLDGITREKLHGSGLTLRGVTT